MTTYITLPSNDPSVLAGSTPGNYIVQLGRSLDFSGGAYEVFLLEARFQMTWHNVEAGENTIQVQGSSAATLEAGYYENVADLCIALNTLLKAEKIVFTPLPRTLKVACSMPSGKTMVGVPLRLLGWPDGRITGSGTGARIADVLGGRSSLFVYLSIVANSQQGSFSVPLLKEIPLQDARPGDTIVYRQPLPVETHKLNTPIVRSAEVNVKDAHNKTVDFHRSPVSLLIGIRPAT